MPASTEAESGDQAVERPLTGEFHCVVLDVMLPGRDGFAVVELPELVARVLALIRRSHLCHQDTVLSVGDVSVDALRRRVTKAGKVIDLSPREFALLEFLTRNAGRTVSRARIAEAVWNSFRY